MKLRPVWLILVGLALATPARAQDVHLRGDDRTRAAQIAREVLQRGNYLRIDRDTVLPDSFRAPGDLVVVDADVRMAGQVAGSAVVLGGHLFLRPGSRVGGSIAVVDGGVYPSGRAVYGTIFESNPSTRVSIAAGADSGLVAQIDPPPSPPVFGYGPRIPTYDRVNGVTLSAGVSVNVMRRANGPALAAWASYRFENEEELGGGARVLVPVDQGVQVVAEASRATRTNDAWAAADPGNSIAAALAGIDYRDYYDADRLSLFVARPLRRPLEAGQTWFGPRIGAQIEEARSLPTREPWSLFGELDRVNPEVAEGQVNSLIGGAELHWAGRVSRLSIDAQVERGHFVEELLPVGDPPVAVDQDFTQLLASGSYQATAFRTHTLRYLGRVMLPIDGSDAPPQRHAILGGVPTIPTLAIGEMRGDHLVWAQGSYTVPMRFILPVLGPPSLELRHTVGAAWSGQDDPEWVQNIGAGVLFSMIGVRAAVDPEDVDHPRVWVTISALGR